MAPAEIGSNVTIKTDATMKSNLWAGVITRPGCLRL
jgi:hypothetical protein